MTNALTILLSAGAYAEICRRAGARGEPAERYLARIVESMAAPAAMAAEGTSIDSAAAVAAAVAATGRPGAAADPG
jgi:hypothetical protein